MKEEFVVVADLTNMWDDVAGQATSPWCFCFVFFFEEISKERPGRSFIEAKDSNQKGVKNNKQNKTKSDLGLFSESDLGLACPFV